MVTAAKVSAFPSDFSLFVSIKSSKAPLLSGFLIICVRMLSMHSRNLDFLCLLCCPSREIFKVLHEGQSLWKWSFFQLSDKDFIQFFLIRGSVGEIHNNMDGSLSIIRQSSGQSCCSHTQRATLPPYLPLLSFLILLFHQFTQPSAKIPNLVGKEIPWTTYSTRKTAR